MSLLHALLTRWSQRTFFAYFTFPQTEAFTFTIFRQVCKMKAYFIAGRWWHIARILYVNRLPVLVGNVLRFHIYAINLSKNLYDYQGEKQLVSQHLCTITGR